VTGSRSRRRIRAALSAALAAAAVAAPHGQTAMALDSIEHVRASLEKAPSKLTLTERKPDFTVHIEKKRPMQDIFEIPPWQLPPIGWQPPAWCSHARPSARSGAAGSRPSRIPTATSFS